MSWYFSCMRNWLVLRGARIPGARLPLTLAGRSDVEPVECRGLGGLRRKTRRCSRLSLCHRLLPLLCQLCLALFDSSFLSPCLSDSSLLWSSPWHIIPFPHILSSYSISWFLSRAPLNLFHIVFLTRKQRNKKNKLRRLMGRFCFSQVFTFSLSVCSTFLLSSLFFSLSLAFAGT